MVADFAAVGRYLTNIKSLELKGPDGIGQRRFLTLGDGTLTVSELVALDPDTMSLTYRILETKLPLTDYTATQKVRRLSDLRSEVVWTASFRCQGVSSAEASSFLNEQLQMGLRNLKTSLEGGSA